MDSTKTHTSLHTQTHKFNACVLHSNNQSVRDKYQTTDALRVQSNMRSTSCALNHSAESNVIHTVNCILGQIQKSKSTAVNFLTG